MRRPHAVAAPIKVGFIDNRWLHVPGGGGTADVGPEAVTPRSEGESWIVSAARHWNVDRDDPR